MKTETMIVDPRRLQRLTLTHMPAKEIEEILDCSDRLGCNLLNGVIPSVSAAHSTRGMIETTNAAKRSFIKTSADRREVTRKLE